MPGDAEHIFELACELRAQRRLADARERFLECLALVAEEENPLRSAVYSQLAFIEDLIAQDAPDDAARVSQLSLVAQYAARAVETNENSELPSLQLFIVLSKLGRTAEAFAEAIRFLRRRPSEEYRSMLNRRHAEERDPEIAELAETVRKLIAAHPNREPET